MKLHEFQAKSIFKDRCIPVPKSVLVSSSDQINEALHDVPGPPWIIKAQIHAGGRGKAGGIRVVHHQADVSASVKQLLNKPLITKQTGPKGVTVREVLIEEGVPIATEYYLSILVDRSTAMPTLIFSQAGGMDIEDVAQTSPDLIMKEHISPVTGWTPYHARNLIYALNRLPDTAVIRSLMSVMEKLYHLFIQLDGSLIEINPLAVTTQGEVMALDAKVNVDGNALFRHKERLKLDDPSEKDPLEVMAEEVNLNYIRLDGNIGAMVNGAGLAMATMDIIKLAGAEPANFLDVGGGASEEMITKGFEIILKDERVKAILINIFGGILRCDVLANGVIQAAKKHDIQVPLIVRLEGTNVEKGRKILEKSHLKFLVAKDMGEAARLVAKQVHQEGRL